MSSGLAQDRMRGRVVIDLADIPFVTTEERIREAMLDGLREFSTMVAAAATVRVKLVRIGEASDGDGGEADGTDATEPTQPATEPADG